MAEERSIEVVEYENTLRPRKPLVNGLVVPLETTDSTSTAAEDASMIDGTVTPPAVAETTKEDSQFTPVSQSISRGDTNSSAEEVLVEKVDKTFYGTSHQCTVPAMMKKLGISKDYQNRVKKYCQDGEDDLTTEGEDDLTTEGDQHKDKKRKANSSSTSNDEALKEKREELYKLFKKEAIPKRETKEREGEKESEVGPVEDELKEPVWLETMAELGKLSTDPAIKKVTYERSPYASLKKSETFRENRKPDTALRASTSEVRGVDGILCFYEFTLEKGIRPKVGSNLNAKIFQLVALLRSVFPTQAHRLFQLGISIHPDVAFIFLLDRVSLQWCEINAPWTTLEGFVSLVAAIKSIEQTSIQNLGFPSFYKYDDNLVPTDLITQKIPHSTFTPLKSQNLSEYRDVELPLRTIKISNPSSNSFQRATLVFGERKPDLKATGFSAVSVRHVNSTAAHRTVMNHEIVGASLHYPVGTTVPLEPNQLDPYSATLVYSACFALFPHQLSDEEVLNHNNSIKETKNGPIPVMVQRHLELEVVATTSELKALATDTPYSTILTAVRDGVEKIREYDKLGFLHRDISSTNLMYLEPDDASDKIRGIIIDLDMGRAKVWTGERREEMTGTFSSMALEPLSDRDRFIHRSRYDIESIDMVLLKLVFDKISHASNSLVTKSEKQFIIDWKKFITSIGLVRDISHASAKLARFVLHEKKSFFSGLFCLVTHFPTAIPLITLLLNIGNIRIARMGFSKTLPPLNLSAHEELAWNATNANSDPYNSDGGFLTLCDEYGELLKEELERIRTTKDPFIDFLNGARTPDTLAINERSSKGKGKDVESKGNEAKGEEG